MNKLKVLETAPPAVSALWDEVEQFAGLELAIEPSAVGRAYYRIRADGGVIGLPQLDAVSWSDVAHELMHIRRYWVEEVPRVCDSTGFFANVSWLENILEHIHINPRVDALLGSKDPQRQADAVELANAEFGSDAQRICDCFAAALLLERGIYTPEQSALIKGRLKAERLLDLRPAARRTIAATLKSKPAGIRIACASLGIRVETLHLRRFDIRNRTERDFPLPGE